MRPNRVGSLGDVVDERLLYERHELREARRKQGVPAADFGEREGRAVPDAVELLWNGVHVDDGADNVVGAIARKALADAAKAFRGGVAHHRVAVAERIDENIDDLLNLLQMSE